jgi:hypothetical protein
MNPFQTQFLVAQKDTECGSWAFYVEGREVYSNSDLGALLNWLRQYAGYDLPQALTIKLQPLTHDEYATPDMHEHRRLLRISIQENPPGSAPNTTPGLDWTA